MPPRSSKDNLQSSESKTWEFESAEDLDFVLIFGPKGSLKELNQKTLTLRNNLLNGLFIPEILEAVAVDDSNVYSCLYDEARGLVSLVHGLVELVNGELGEPSKKFAGTLRYVASRMETWPVNCDLRQMPDKYETFARKTLQLGSKTTSWRRKKHSNAITRVAEKIFNDFFYFHDHQMEGAFELDFCYLGQVCPPVNKLNWCFWKIVACDYLDLNFGPPELRNKITEKIDNERLKRKKGAPPEEQALMDAIFPARNHEELKAIAAKLKRLDPKPTVATPLASLPHKKTNPKVWTFAENDQTLRERVRSRNLGLKSDRALYNRFRREVLKTLEAQILSIPAT